MSFIRQDLAELTKQLQGREPSPRHADFMDTLRKCAEQEGKQVARVGYTEPPTYCIVDDDLQPVAPQPTKSNQMMHKLSSLALALTCGLASSIPNSFNGYGLGSSPSGGFICNTDGKPSGYSRTRKQNLRNSQRKGKQYKQRKAA